MADYRVAPGLLDRAKTGDLGAFEQIMRMHEKQVLSTALRLLGNREDAQDAAQEAFLRLHRSLGRLGEVQEAGAWLYRVTVNLCNDLHRARRRTQTVALTGPEPVSVSPDPEAAWRDSERWRLVEQALATLPEKERAAVVLRDVQGLSTREVAGILGSSETTVRSQISVARVKLKKFTERYLRKRQ
jgi:RNA polymerase sigma-70 factor (ECF subfamily)